MVRAVEGEGGVGHCHLPVPAVPAAGQSQRQHGVDPQMPLCGMIVIIQDGMCHSPEGRQATCVLR